MKNVKQRLTTLFVMMAIMTCVNLNGMGKHPDISLGAAFNAVGVNQTKLLKARQNLEEIFKTNGKKIFNEKGMIYPNFLKAVGAYDGAYQSFIESKAQLTWLQNRKLVSEEEFMKRKNEDLFSLTKLKEKVENDLRTDPNYNYLLTNLASGNLTQDRKKLQQESITYTTLRKKITAQKEEAEEKEALEAVEDAIEKATEAIQSLEAPQASELRKKLDEIEELLESSPRKG